MIFENKLREIKSNATKNEVAFGKVFWFGLRRWVIHNLSIPNILHGQNNSAATSAHTQHSDSELGSCWKYAS